MRLRFEGFEPVNLCFISRLNIYYITTKTFQIANNCVPYIFILFTPLSRLLLIQFLDSSNSTLML